MDHIKNFHSLPSLYFFVLFSIGISISWIIGNLFNLTVLIILYAIFFVLLFFLYKNKKSFFYICFLLFVLVGLIRMWLALYPFSPDEMNMFHYEYDAFQGTIIETDYRDLKSNVYVLK